MTLEEKINWLRAAEKRLWKHLSEDEFGVVGRTAETFGREADWLEELKRYRDLEERGRLLVLPCKAAEHPQETRLTQFLKHYPNALMDDDGTPEVCVNELGLNRDEGCVAMNCIRCWNTPIEE